MKVRAVFPSAGTPEGVSLDVSRARLLVATTAVAAVVWLSFVYADVLIASAIDRRRHADETVWRALTRLGEAGPYLLVSGLIALATRLWRRSARVYRTALYVFTTISVSGLAALALKSVIGRYRPGIPNDGAYGFDAFSVGFQTASFPSGHAATAFSAAMACALLWPRRRWLWASLSVGVAISRVMLHRHYLGDVVAGAWLGAVVAVALHPLLFGARSGTVAEVPSRPPGGPT